MMPESTKPAPPPAPIATLRGVNWFPEDLVSAYAATLLAEEPVPPRSVNLTRLVRANVYLALIVLAFPGVVVVVAVAFSRGTSPLPFVFFAVGFTALMVGVFAQSVYSAKDALQRGVVAAGQVIRIDPAYRSTVAVIRVDLAGVATESQVRRSGASSTLYAGDTVQTLVDPETGQVLLIIGVLQPSANPAPPQWVRKQDRINAVVFTAVGAVGVVAAIVFLGLSWRISGEHDAHDAAVECSAPSQALSGTGCRWVGRVEVLRRYDDQNSIPHVDVAFDGLPGRVFTANFARGDHATLAAVQEGVPTTAELWQGIVVELDGTPTENDTLLRLPLNAWILGPFFGLLGIPLFIAGLVYGRKAGSWGRRYITSPPASSAPSAP